MPFSRAIALGAAALAAASAAVGCGGESRSVSTTTTKSTTPAPTTPLPGAGKPQVTIGDKNFTEQFVLGELYSQALTAEGFTVVLDRNIGPTEVRIQALESRRLDMYPEYLGTWNSTIAGDHRGYRSAVAAYDAAQQYAHAHGLELLDPTPFSDTDALAVTFNFAEDNGLRAVGDLRKVAPTMTIGAPPQFTQSIEGLPALEQAYGFVPLSVKALAVGDQYAALDRGVVEAVDVNTTDGQLLNGFYRVLRDPKHVLGWGYVVPVVSSRVLDVEGPVFAETINKVSSLLSQRVIRQLNAAVDIYHQDPALVAKEFLMANGLMPATSQ